MLHKIGFQRSQVIFFYLDFLDFKSVFLNWQQPPVMIDLMALYRLVQLLFCQQAFENK